MSKIARFVVWICSKFTRVEIEQIVNGLLDVLNNHCTEVRPKDDFKEKHPNYRNFFVDPLPPLTEVPAPKQSKDYKLLLAEYQATHDKPLETVQHRSDSLKAPELTLCPLCNAPHSYLYYNDGKKKTQLKCKVCEHLFQLGKRFRKNHSGFFCPYCHYALFTWKQRTEVTIYKCPNDSCPHRLSAIRKLNPKERTLQKTHSSQFKLCYQYLQYHFQFHDILHSSPDKPKVDLSKIHNSDNTLGLILTFYVSFAITARKTASILKSVFNLPVSYQTVLNYAEAAAFSCHRFNLINKGTIDTISAGDETYIKIQGSHAFVFLFISSSNHKITAYHVADNRGAQPAIAAMHEAIRTSTPEQEITLVTDGNPSHPAGIHFLNSLRKQMDSHSTIQHHKVIGLQNLDKESEEFRPFKQLIERLNRTYKHHVKPAHGFNSYNGAVSLTALFVTHYNFLRPHMSLGYKTPVHMPKLDPITTIQGQMAKNPLPRRLILPCCYESIPRLSILA